MSTQDTVDRFVAALRRLEDDGEVDPLVELFADDARVETATGSGDLRGPDGARTLWGEDRQRFGSVSSDFRSTIVDGDRAALEWRREATGPDGDDVSHTGVTVLEVADGRVARLGVYFDPTILTAGAR